MNKHFNISGVITAEEICEKIKTLGNSILTPTSHLFPEYNSSKIIDASKLHSKRFCSIAQERPAVGLIEVVLSANRSYVRHVKHNIDRIVETSDIASFDDLTNYIYNIGEHQFYIFWGHRNAQKFSVLTNILRAAQALRKIHSNAKDDYELMNEWARSIDLNNYKEDCIGSIRHIAIATIQHLRMTFGCNTVKPDLRVKEVLMNEFGLGWLSDIKAIEAVEQISHVTGYSALLLDQIFVNYGSGYYNRVEGWQFERNCNNPANSTSNQILN